MARRREQQDDVEAAEPRSRAAGVLVVVALGGVAVAAVFAASRDTGVLVVWVVAGVALWRSARRRKGPDLPLPSPTVPPSRGDVFAVETGRAARVVRGQGGPTIVYPEIRYVTEDELP